MVLIIYRPDTQLLMTIWIHFLANAEDTAEKHGVHIFSTFNQRVSNYQTRLYIYGDDTVVRDSLKSTMDIEEKTYTALIGGITVIEFEDFREAKTQAMDRK